MTTLQRSVYIILLSIRAANYLFTQKWEIPPFAQATQATNIFIKGGLMIESTDIHGPVNKQASLVFAKYFQRFSKDNFPYLKGSLSTALLVNAFDTILECQILLQTVAQSNEAALAIVQSERRLARRILVSNCICIYHH